MHAVLFAAALRCHKMRTHSNVVLACPHCSYTTYAANALQLHIDSQHLGRKALACPSGCGYRTAYSGNMPKHTKRCTKYAEFYNSIWDPETQAFVCPGCKTRTFILQRFFKHYSQCVAKPTEPDEAPPASSSENTLAVRDLEAILEGHVEDTVTLGAIEDVGEALEPAEEVAAQAPDPGSAIISQDGTPIVLGSSDDLVYKVMRVSGAQEGEPLIFIEIQSPGNVAGNPS